MNTAFDLLSGVSWCVVYVTALVLGIKHKTWCIPRIAICQNFAWEFWIVISKYVSGAAVSVGYVVQLSWLILDIMLVAIWLWYERKHLVRNILLFSFILAVMYLLAYQAKQWAYMAYIINVVMSALFLLRLHRDPGQWVSMTIAVWKLVGTVAATIVGGLVNRHAPILWLGGLCLILDIAYLYVLFGYKKECSI